MGNESDKKLGDDLYLEILTHSLDVRMTEEELKRGKLVLLYPSTKQRDAFDRRAHK